MHLLKTAQNKKLFNGSFQRNLGFVEFREKPKYALHPLLT